MCVIIKDKVCVDGLEVNFFKALVKSIKEYMHYIKAEYIFSTEKIINRYQPTINRYQENKANSLI